MKRLAAIIGFAVLCLNSTIWAAEQPVNLAGRWILDVKHSDPFPHPLQNLGAPQMGGSEGNVNAGGGGMGSTPSSRDFGGGMPGGRMGGGMPGGGSGRGPQSTAQNAPMIIDQSESELRISRTGMVMGKEVPVAENYILDGAEHAQTTQIPGSPDPVKVVTSAKLKKNSLLVRITTYSPKNKGEIKKEFSLSKDGNTLTVRSSNMTPMGEMIQSQVYHKEE